MRLYLNLVTLDFVVDYTFSEQKAMYVTRPEYLWLVVAATSPPLTSSIASFWSLLHSGESSYKLTKHSIIGHLLGKIFKYILKC
jgi:hypothetical protein